MEFFVNLIYAFLLVGSGTLLIKYRRNVKGWTGNFYWAEHYLGRGSTYFIIIMLGLFLMFWGVLYPFGGADFFSGDTTNINLQIKK